MLFDRSHPGADRLGHQGCGGPRPSRVDGARRDARLPPRDLRRLRPLSRSTTTRPASSTSSSASSTPPRPPNTIRPRCAGCSRSGGGDEGRHRPGRHPGRGARTRWVPTSAAPPDHLDGAAASAPYSRAMGIDVTVLRVFTDSRRQFRQSARRGRCQPGRARRPATAGSPIGLQRNGIRRSPRRRAQPPRTPPSTPRASRSRSPGTPPSARRGGCGRTVRRSTRCRCRPASCRCTTRATCTGISARSEWAPEFAVHEFDSVDDLLAADPGDFPDDTAHYLWAWIDRARRIAAFPDVRRQSRCARRRSDRLRGDADHRLPQPRPAHHPGQGIDASKRRGMPRAGSGWPAASSTTV